MCLRPFGLYCSACLDILFVPILCMCCSHFSWYCFISVTIFCAPVFSLMHWFFSLSSFVIPSKCLKIFICAASKRCSSLFFSTQASLPNFNTRKEVICKFYLSSFPLCTMNRVTHSCDTSAFIQQIYWLKTVSSLTVVLRSVNFPSPLILINLLFKLMDGRNILLPYFAQLA